MQPSTDKGDDQDVFVLLGINGGEGIKPRLF
jgi:hypothetical protein